MEQHAYAKLNLTLGVVGTRADGYHLLSSVFHAIDLSDTLTVTTGHADMQLISPAALYAARRQPGMARGHTFCAGGGRQLDCHIHIESAFPCARGWGRQCGCGRRAAHAVHTVPGRGAGA